MERLFLVNLLMTLRNRQALFWTLFFPLIFIFIFGLFFGRGTMDLGKVAVVDEAASELTTKLVEEIKQNESFNIATDYVTVAEARDALIDNTVVGVLVLPESFGERGGGELTVITAPANVNANGALLALANGLASQLNQQALAAALPPAAQPLLANPSFTVRQEETGNRQLTYFDFILIGIIGMSLMNSSINGVAIAMSKYREDQILKRITTTPLPTWQFIVAEVLARLVVNVVQIGIIIAVGLTVFDGHIYGNYFTLLSLALLAAVLFQLAGFVVAAVTSSTRAAEGMTTAITMPMMFLAGVFFPTDTLPAWLQEIVKFLPLEPLLTMLRQSALEEVSVWHEPKNMVIVAGWIAALLWVAVRRFRLSAD